MLWSEFISSVAFGIVIGIVIGASYVASKDKSVKEIMDEAEEVEYLLDLGDLR